MFSKVLIATSGDSAIRAIEVFKKYGTETIATFSNEERDALHKRLADRACYIGSHENRNNYAMILGIAEREKVDAIYLGYDRLAEDPNFIKECKSLGLETFTPEPEVMEMWKNRLTARKLFKNFGFDVVPGSDKLIESVDDVREAMEEYGPVILKGIYSGGGKASKVIHHFNETEVEKTLEELKSRERLWFSKGGICATKFLCNNPVWHLEFQIAMDKKGNCVRVGTERDCSTQWKYQKIIEEAPSPSYLGITIETREKIGEMVVNLANSTKIIGLSTTEFLFSEGKFLSNEINIRRQVEIGITEKQVGENLIDTQIKIGAEEELPWTQEEIDRKIEKHVIECRISARSPRLVLGYPGIVTRFVKPEDPGIRVDTALYQGCKILQYDDPLILKLMASGKTREEAIGRMDLALNDLVIEGVSTSGGKMRTDIAFHKAFLRIKEFREGSYDTCIVERLMKDSGFILEVENTEKALEERHKYSLSSRISYNGHVDG